MFMHTVVHCPMSKLRFIRNVTEICSNKRILNALRLR